MPRAGPFLGRKDRAFSSGCIRVVNEIELAEILPADPVKWDRQSILEALDTNETRRVYLPKPKWIILFYATIRFDKNDNYIFKKI